MSTESEDDSDSDTNVGSSDDDMDYSNDDDIPLATALGGEPEFPNDIGYGGLGGAGRPTSFQEFAEHFLYICAKHYVSKVAF